MRRHVVESLAQISDLETAERIALLARGRRFSLALDDLFDCLSGWRWTVIVEQIQISATDLDHTWIDQTRAFIREQFKIAKSKSALSCVFFHRYFSPYALSMRTPQSSQ